ncbi:MAG TPA: Rnase Y domain-containing protein, partial [Bacteroidales bacterium]|nr:Rnase Y domain-containing protein [Bacteroidales bacterium]
MLDIVYLAVSGIAGLVLGFIITATLLRKAVEKKSEKLLIEAQEKAEVYKKDKILQAKEKFLQLKIEHEKVINEKNSQI